MGGSIATNGYYHAPETGYVQPMPNLPFPVRQVQPMPKPPP